jgi:hypothetical protein
MSIRASRSFVVSAAALIAGALLCLVALARAITVEPVVPVDTEPAGFAAGPEITVAPPARVPSEGVLPIESLALAVDNDPFMPDRRRATPYRLPGETVESRPVVERRPEAEPPPFRVIGTASTGDTGIALVELLESGAPEVVRIGGSLLGYRLQSVSTESATLVRAEQTLTLAVQSGSGGGVTSRSGSPEDQLRDALQRYQAVVERLGEDGGLNAAALRALVGGRGGSIELPVFQFAPQRGGRGGRGGRINIDVRRDTLLWIPRAPQP